MADHEPRSSGRRPTQLTRHDLTIGAAHAEHERAHQHGAVRGGRFGNLLDAR
jgi:hypothetical protein